MGWRGIQTTERNKSSYHYHFFFFVKKIKRQTWQEGEEKVFLLGGEETGPYFGSG